MSLAVSTTPTHLCVRNDEKAVVRKHGTDIAQKRKCGGGCSNVSLARWCANHLS